MHYGRRCGSYHISFGRWCPGAFFRLVRPVQDLPKAFWGIQFEGLSLRRRALSSCPPQRSNRLWKVEEMNLRPREKKWSKAHHGTQIKAQDSTLQANMCCGHPRADHRFLSSLSLPKAQNPWWHSLFSLMTGRRQHEAMAKRTGPPGTEKCSGYLWVSWAATASSCPREDCGYLGSHQPGQAASAWVFQLCPWCAGRVESAGKGEAHGVLGSNLGIRFRLCKTPVRL